MRSILCLMVVIVGAAFWETTRNGFVACDDPIYVTENPIVGRGLTPSGVVWAFQTDCAGNWHPVTWISHMLDVEIFGANAGCHHFTSLLLHTVNTLLLFLVLRRT